jgi:hypothetical protein
VFRFVALALALSVGTTLGLAGAALGTGNGRSVLVGALLGFANRSLRGTVTVESIAGSVYQGLLAQGVRIVGHDGRPLIDIGTLNLRYRLTDLLSRRIVLGQLELSRARVNLEQRRGERFNYQTVLRLGEGSGGGGRGPLVAFRNVRLNDVAIVIRTPSGEDTSRMNERHVTVPVAHLSYVRVSSPFPGEGAVVLDVAGLRGRIDQPGLDIQEASGQVEVLGDTVTFDLERAMLPGTRTTMQGRLWSLGDGPRFDLDFRAERFQGADVLDFVPWLPPDATGRGRLAVASPMDDRVDVDARELQLTMGDGGTVRGSLALHLGPGEAWTAEAVDLVSANFDLAYLHGLFDSLPMDGRLTGRTQARGPSTGVTVDLRWRFFDRRADSAETGLGGSGIVIFGADEGITFREFQVDSAAVALATVRAMSPGIALTGTLDAVGRLDGPLLNATFQGALAHRKDTLPVSRALGDVRLDLRGDTAAVWGTLAFDSIAWDGIRPDYPQVPLLGAMAGEVRMAGPMDALRLDLELRGPRGALSGGGTVILMAPHLGARDLGVRFSGLELLPVERSLPRTAFSGTVTGMVEADTLVPTRMDVALALGPSQVGGTLVDSVRAGLRVQEDMLAVDTLRVWLRGIALSGSGGLALHAPGSDTLVLRLEADSLVALAPLVLGLVGRDTLALARDTLRGTVAGTVTASGALDALEAAWSLDGARVGLNEIEIHGARAGGEWSSTAAGRMAITLEVDSVLRRERRFDRVIADAAGTRDSVHWMFQGGIGAYAAVRGGGVWVRRASWEIRPDSLVVDVAGERWTLSDGAALHVTDSAVGIRRVSLATGSGRSRLTLSGTVPRTGAGRFEGAIEALPLSQVWALLQRDPADAAGVLSGTFRVGGSARDPVMDVSFSLRDAVFDEFRAPLTDGTVTYANRRLTGTLNMWRSGARVLGVDVELPLDLGFIDVRRRRLPGPLTVRARAEGVDLALLSATSPLIRQTEGRLWADMGLTGEWERPQLTGYLEVRDGAATFPALGVRHRQLNGRLTMGGDSIRVDSLSTWSGQGYASIRGVVRLEALSRPVLDLTIESNEFRAMAVPDFLTLTASGTLALSGPVVGAVLTGSGTVTRGALHFADIIEKELVNLDPLTVDSATAAIIRRERLGPDFENRFLDSLRVENLRLQMGADVHLRSTEADILLSGDVLVGKIADRYRIDGTLRTPRGTYDLFLGPIRRRFNVTRGEVRYFGTPDLNAALDIDARHQLRGARGEDVTVFVHVGGTILEPELRLSSDVRPTLSEAEVINYLVFGAPNAQAVTGDVGAYGAQQSLTSLTGQISGQITSALIADLGVPLDYLEFRPQLGQSPVAAEIAGGLRLSDRVFVTVSPRFCRKQAFSVQNLGGTVEFELGSGWSLLASADPVRVCNLSGTAGFGQQLQLGVDLFWERRF